MMWVLKIFILEEINQFRRHELKINNDRLMRKSPARGLPSRKDKESTLSF
jgi:hypothetical protein